MTLPFDPAPAVPPVTGTPAAAAGGASDTRRPRHGTILLVDMDAFFASVEQSLHPHLRGRPVIVCGDPSRRGVVTAASYEARPTGVRAGMPLQEARRLCPHAEYVEGNPEKYVERSLELLDLYLTHTPDVEPFSVDEAFLGLAPRATLDDGLAMARRIQAEIDERFALGASVGIGPNKLVAKMAAGLRKPRGLTVLDEAGFRDAFWPLDVQELWGVGPKLAARMRAMGIATIGDLAHAQEPALAGAYGMIGPQLREAARGHDATPLVPSYEGVDPKSMGHEVTLERDSGDAAQLESVLLRLCDQVARRLRKEGFVGRVVAVRLRDASFTTRIRQRALAGHTDRAERLFEVVRALFHDHWQGGALRLVGVSVSALEPSPESAQTDLFADGGRSDKLLEALDRVRDKLGEVAVVPAATLRRAKRGLRHVPFGAMSSRVRQRPADDGDA